MLNELKQQMKKNHTRNSQKKSSRKEYYFKLLALSSQTGHIISLGRSCGINTSVAGGGGDHKACDEDDDSDQMMTTFSTKKNHMENLKRKICAFGLFVGLRLSNGAKGFCFSKIVEVCFFFGDHMKFNNLYGSLVWHNTHHGVSNQQRQQASSKKYRHHQQQLPAANRCRLINNISKLELLLFQVLATFVHVAT